MVDNQFNHIVRDFSILSGRPIVKGTRISVALLLEWLATGGSPKSINEAYPQVSVEAVSEALLYASKEVASTEYIS